MIAPLSNPNKALVAKYWIAAVLIDFGYEIELSSRAALIGASKGRRRLTVRSKACYSEDGVPFNGFSPRDSDFVVFVDLRSGVLRAGAWIVPTRVVFEGLEGECEQMMRMGRAGSQVPNRTLYWKEGPGPHYGYERKFAVYRDCWKSLHEALSAKAAA